MFMSFRRILLGLLTFWVVLMGIVFGTLFLICLSLYSLWYGLSMSIIVFGALCLACIIFVQMALSAARRKPELQVREAKAISEEQNDPFALTSSFSGDKDGLKRRKIL